jgi:hypothetical protein
MTLGLGKVLNSHRTVLYRRIKYFITTRKRARFVLAMKRLGALTASAPANREKFLLSPLFFLLSPLFFLLFSFVLSPTCVQFVVLHAIVCIPELSPLFFSILLLSPFYLSPFSFLRSLRYFRRILIRY